MPYIFFLILRLWLFSACFLCYQFAAWRRKNLGFSSLIVFKLRQSTSDSMYSWNQLHEYYTDYWMFSKDIMRCSCRSFLFPVKNTLFYVNEAMVYPMDDTIYIPSTKYTSECKKNDYKLRISKITLGSLGTPDLTLQNVLILPLFTYKSIYHYMEVAAQVLRYHMDRRNPPITAIWLHQKEEVGVKEWVYECLYTALLATNHSEVKMIRKRDVESYRVVSLLDSMISTVEDVLLPFHNIGEVNLLRRTAYARYPDIKKGHYYTIVKRDSECRRILNYEEMEKVVRSQNRTLSVVEFEGKSFGDQVNIMRETHVLIAVHGAALVNIVFMPPGSVLVEIINPRLRAPFYKYLSHFASVRHVEFRNMTQTVACNTKTWNPFLQMNMQLDLQAFSTVLTSID